MTHATPTTLMKFAAEADRFYLDCTDALESASTIIGTPAFTFEPAALTGGDALTFTSVSVNSAAIVFPDGRTGKLGGVILVRIAGGTPASATQEREYTVVATFTDSTGNTKQVRGRLLVLPLKF